MAQSTSQSGSIEALSKIDVQTRFDALLKVIPDLEKYKHTPIIPVLLEEAKCRKLILPVMTRGITDMWLPLKENNIPENFGAGAQIRFTIQQSRILTDTVDVDPSSTLGEHFNLSDSHLRMNHEDIWQLPKGLMGLRNLGEGGSGSVQEVKGTKSGSNYALKRIQRKADFKGLEEQMRYVAVEILVLKKLCNRSPHYIKFVCSYTDSQYIGMLMEPVADCNLGRFLDRIKKLDQENENKIAGFFGCLATALAALHVQFNIRHKDIKPENILIKGNNILLTDFGMALDWSGTGHTTTSQELLRTPKYAAPETSDGLERNSLADIWSLGCVFLEIIAVLKGMSRAQVNKILKNNGSGSENYRQNIQGIAVVVERLKEMEAECGDVPLEWVEKMLKRDKDERPNARELRTMIWESKCELPMWGFCCSKVNIFGESSSTSSVSQPDQPMIPVASGPEGTENNWPAISLEPDLDGLVQSSTDPETQASRELLDHRYDIKGPKSWKGLHWACRKGKVDVVKLLLKHNVDTSIPSSDGTVVHLASAEDHVDVLQLLKEHGLKLDQSFTGKKFEDWKPLHSAVKNSRSNAVEFLLKNDADPCSKVRGGWTPLHSAAENRSMSIAKLLLRYGAKVSEPNDDGITPLHKAAFSGSVAVAELLLKYDADVNERDHNVRTALHAAATSGAFGVAELLLKAGADVDTKDKDGCTPLHWAAVTGGEDIVRLLLKNGADINKLTDKTKATPLWLAARNNRPSVVELLVQQGARTDLVNFHGNGPLHLAVGNGDLEIVKLLLVRANVEQQAGDGKTALHMAAWENRVQVAKLLLEHGAKTESRDDSNWTPLHWAAYRGHRTMTKILLEHGADPDAKDDEGQTPRLRAEHRGHKQVMNQFLEHRKTFPVESCEATDDESRTPIAHDKPTVQSSHPDSS